MKLLFLGLCFFIYSIGHVMYSFGTETTSAKRNIIILLGPPGSGKGTQAARLSKELGIPHISTGDLFRENMTKDTELGKKAKSFIESGKLVPDSLVLDMVFDRISRPDCSKGCLLDGFPRTIPQAQTFDKHLSSNDRLMVIDLEVSDELVVKRLSGRLSCGHCGAIYNRYFNPPAMDNRCDRCDHELQQRSDDKENVIQERLRVYHEQTEPLVKYYSDKKVLTVLNGEKDPEEVFQELLKIVNP